MTGGRRRRAEDNQILGRHSKCRVKYVHRENEALSMGPHALFNVTDRPMPHTNADARTRKMGGEGE